MGGRLLGVALLLALLAGLGVYAVEELRQVEPSAIASPAPIPVPSPGYPGVEVEVRPDLDLPAFEPGRPTHTELVGAPPFQYRLPVPDGWARTSSSAGEFKWSVPEHPDNVYFLRVNLLSAYTTVPGARDARIELLDEATSTTQFDLEERTDDGFVASYVSEGFRRLTHERFVSVDGTERTTATIAVVGRMADRAGLAWLADLVAAEFRSRTS